MSSLPFMILQDQTFCLFQNPIHSHLCALLSLSVNIVSFHSLWLISIILQPLCGSYWIIKISRFHIQLCTFALSHHLPPAHRTHFTGNVAALNSCLPTPPSDPPGGQNHLREQCPGLSLGKVDPKANHCFQETKAAWLAASCTQIGTCGRTGRHFYNTGHWRETAKSRKLLESNAKPHRWHTQGRGQPWPPGPSLTVVTPGLVKPSETRFTNHL